MPAASIMRFCGSLAFVRQASVYRYLYLDGFVVTFPSTRPCRLANSFFPSQHCLCKVSVVVGPAHGSSLD